MTQVFRLPPATRRLHLMKLPHKPQLGGTGIPDDFWWGISPEGIGTLGMLINFVVAISVSRLTTKPPKDVQELTESIRTPRGSISPKNSLH